MLDAFGYFKSKIHRYLTVDNMNSYFVASGSHLDENDGIEEIYNGFQIT